MARIKIATIIGARPQFIKAAAISRILSSVHSSEVEELIIHTGQHYDDNMSQIFFDELKVPKPAYYLEVGSGSHGYMTGEIIRKVEEVMVKTRPDIVIVYGDTNTTLGGAVAAAKLHIPLAHVEAGLRSFNKSMPEEINRILCDHVSTLLFSPTEAGVINLVKEGFNSEAKKPYSPDNPKVYHCGDVMYDNALHFSKKAEKSSSVLKDMNLNGREFALCTIHRDSNTDATERLRSILEAIDAITREFKLPVVIPVHPRTYKMIETFTDTSFIKKIAENPLIIRTAPVGYLEMLLLEKNARIILTDSGGVQKEAYFFQKPCIVLRAETEWKELLEQKAALLADADQDRIMDAFRHFYNNAPSSFPSLYGDGKAAEFICSEIVGFCQRPVG